MKQLILFITLLGSLTFSHAQTADEIIQKHLDATGGADKWKNVKTLYSEAVVVTPNGQEVNTKVWKIQGKGLRREVDFGMGNMKMVVTSDKGWVASPRNGGSFEPMPESMREEQSWETDINPLSDYAAKGYKAELVGKETFDGKEAYKIKVTNDKGKERNFFIDAGSFFLVKETFMGRRERPRNPNGGGGTPEGPTEQSLVFENHTKTPEGFVFPFTVSMGPASPKVNYEKIEVNPVIDEKKLMEGVQ